MIRDTPLKFFVNELFLSCQFYRTSQKSQSWAQFHQRFTCSFYAHGSRKRKNIQLSHQYIFTLSGSRSIKAARKTLMKLSLWGHVSLRWKHFVSFYFSLAHSLIIIFFSFFLSSAYLSFLSFILISLTVCFSFSLSFPSVTYTKPATHTKGNTQTMQRRGRGTPSRVPSHPPSHYFGPLSSKRTEKTRQLDVVDRPAWHGNVPIETKKIRQCRQSYFLWEQQKMEANTKKIQLRQSIQSIAFCSFKYL